MSYCRFSDLNGYCDVYVYQSACGWETHIATKRRPPGRPLSGLAFAASTMPNPLPEIGAEEFLRWVNEGNDAMEICREWDAQNPPIAIDHPLAGQSCRHDTPSKCADHLEHLKAQGFNVPDWAIANLRDEAQEDA